MRQRFLLVVIVGAMVVHVQSSCCYLCVVYFVLAQLSITTQMAHAAHAEGEGKISPFSSLFLSFFFLFFGSRPHPAKNLPGKAVFLQGGVDPPRERDTHAT